MKILLLTHNPICTQNNMGKTFLSLFSEFEQNQLCQLYIHSDIPDVKICSSYFQITDKMVLKSVFIGMPGRELSSTIIDEQIKKRESGESFLPAKWKGVNPFKCLLRDALWKISNWYSPKLKAWLDKEAPTVIFLAPGYAKFIYDIALKIADERNLPIVTYICDDYYFVKTPRSYIGRKHLSLLRKKTDELMEKTGTLVAITQEIAEAYTSYFGVESKVIMTGADLYDSPKRMSKLAVENISYFGNLSVGRDESLIEIGRALDYFNTIHASNVVLRIYAGNIDAEIVSALEDIECVKICGFVTGDSFENEFYSSDMLIHVESFQSAYIDIVKYSLSTKIAASLASGIPILAYAPEQIASMQHLIRNDCAFAATSKEDLISVLELALTENKIRDKVTRNALNIATQYHDKQKNSILLKNVFSSIERNACERITKKRT